MNNSVSDFISAWTILKLLNCFRLDVSQLHRQFNIYIFFVFSEGDVASGDHGAASEKIKKEKKKKKKGSKKKDSTTKTKVQTPEATVQAGTPATAEAIPYEDITTNNVQIKSFVDDQVYANQETIAEESRNSEETEDEYVNIASTSQADDGSEDNKIEHQIIEDTEYAVIVKRNQRELVDELTEALKAKLQHRDNEEEEPEVQEAEISQNNEVHEPDNIIEPPCDFKDGQEEKHSNEPETGSSVEQTYDNMTYSNESFQEAIANIRNSKSDDTKTSKAEDSSQIMPDEENVVAETAKSNETQPSGQVETIESVEHQKEEFKEDEDGQAVQQDKNLPADSDESAKNEKNVSQNDTMERSEKTIVIIELKPPKMEPVDSSSVETNEAANAIKDVESVVENIEKTVSDSLVETTPENHIEGRNSQELKNRKPVILMKEVGVQAPDIYIPLDADRDFRLSEKKTLKVDIGIQVQNMDLEADQNVTLVDTLNSENSQDSASAD